MARRDRKADQEQLQALHERLDRREAMVEGLQDALYRQAVAQDERSRSLERKTEPQQLARALSEDARERGL